MRRRRSGARLFAAAVLAAVAGAGQAQAAISRTVGPNTILSEPRAFVKFDAAFDSVNRVYLVVWGTQVAGPVNGLFLNESGSPIGSAFAISGGPQQSGWARVTFSAEQGKFLVSYTKIIAAGHHQRDVRFVTYAGSGAGTLGAEIVLDDWLGDAGTGTGLTYASASGKFIVTWSHYSGSFPASFATAIDPAGNHNGPHVLTNPGDGQADPEIACDPVERRCMVIGTSWGVYSYPQSANWGRFIDDNTSAPLGNDSFYITTYISLRDPSALVFNPTTAKFLVGFARGPEIWGMLAPRGGGNTASGVGAPFLIRRSVNGGLDGVGYGFPTMSYNSGTGTTMTTTLTWIGLPGVFEVDGNGVEASNGFDLIPDTAENPSDIWNTRTQFTVSAANNVANGFLVLDNHYFKAMRTTAYGGTAGTCITSATPNLTSIAGGGGSLNVTVTAPGTCNWTASSNSSWITGGGSAAGNSTALFTIALNTGPTRTGSLTVGGQTISITQSGCTYAISSLGSSLSSAGALNGAIGVAAPPGCSWIPVTSANWIATGGPGTGNGFALFSTPRNPYTSTRVGVISVGGWNYTVTQAPSVANDLTDDGRPDLLFQHNVSGTASDGQIGLWSMQGEVQSGTALVDVSETDTNWKIAGMADFDRNGSPDIVWRNAVTGANRVWLMDGTHFLSEWAITGVSNTAYKIVGIADFNSDFIPDILWQVDGSGQVGLWYMTRANDGSFVALDTRYLFTVPNYTVRGIADFNRDGYPDIVWQNNSVATANSADIAVWFMRWNATTGTPAIADTRQFSFLNGPVARVFDTNYQIVAVGDFNNDLRADIVWQNVATGYLAIWLTWDNTVLDTRYLSVQRLTDTGWRIVGPR